MKCMVKKGFGTFERNGMIYVPGDFVDVPRPVALKSSHVLLALTDAQAKGVKLAKGIDKTKKPGFRKLQKSIQAGNRRVEKIESNAPIEKPPEKPPEDKDSDKDKEKGEEK